MRVLVVDDDARSRIGLIKALHKARYTAVPFISVPPALEYLAKNQVDAALIDFLLPGPNGLMLAERLRVMRPACPIIMISNHAQIDDLEKAFQVGIDDFVLRPVKPDVLLERLAKAIMRRAEISAGKHVQLGHLELG